MQKKQGFLLFAIPALNLSLMACLFFGSGKKTPVKDTPTLTTALPPVETISLPPTQETLPAAAPQQGGKRLVQVPVAGQSSIEVMDLLVSPQGELWVATIDGIYIHSAEGWRHELEGVAISNFAGYGHSGVVWALSYTSEEIYAYSNGQWKKYNSAQGWELFPVSQYLSPGITRSVAESPDGYVWLATGRDDLRRYDPARDRWEIFSAEQIGFPVYDNPDYQGYFLTDVAVSGTGKVLVGSCIGQGELLAGRGVVSFSNGRWNSIDAVETACVMDIEALPDGDVFVGDFNHLFWYRSATGNWQKDPLPGFERPQLVRHIDVDAIGQLWVRARRMGGASSYGETAVYYKQKNEDWSLVYEETEGWAGNDFAVDPAGAVYFSYGGAVYRWHAGKLEELGDLPATVTLLAVDGSGLVWAAPVGDSDHGLWKIGQ